MFLQIRLPFTGTVLRFSFWFFAVVGLFAAIDHTVLILYIALPIAIHECGHLVAMLLCGVRVREIHFTPVDIRMVTRGTGRLTYAKELAVASAGIAANLLAALLLRLLAFQSMRTMLMLASNLAVAFFNLLPVGSLDGGQIVKILCGRLLSPNAAVILSRVVGFVVMVPLTALAGFLLLRGQGNFTLAIACLYLLVTLIARE